MVAAADGAVVLALVWAPWRSAECSRLPTTMPPTASLLRPSAGLLRAKALLSASRLRIAAGLLCTVCIGISVSVIGCVEFARL